MTRLPHDSATTMRKLAARRVCRCVTKGCKKAAAHHRKTCNTCRDRKWRAAHPEHHLWNNLRKSAKRRGYDFTIRLEWWFRFCELTGFAEMCGRTKGSASIDRVDPTRGYHEDNVQVLEIGANSSKGQDPAPINSEEHFSRSADEAF